MSNIELTGLYKKALLAREDVVAAGVEVTKVGSEFMGTVYESYPAKSKRRTQRWLPVIAPSMKELRKGIHAQINKICYEFFYQHHNEKKGKKKNVG